MESTCKQETKLLIDQLSQKNPSFRANRIFVLDTNVLLHDPSAINAFKNVVIIIPFIVLEELDKFKREPGEKGLNARQTIRALDELRSHGCLSTGVIINHHVNSLLMVTPNPTEITFLSITGGALQNEKDNLIIQTVHNLKHDGNKVTLVTKDINVRVKADALALDAEDYTRGKISYEHFYKGWIRIPVAGAELNTFTEKTVARITAEYTLFMHQYIILENQDKPTHYRLFRNYGHGQFREIEDITLLNTFRAKNIQQLMALDLLLDDDIKLITLLGPAGTGKTFLALLAGLYKVAYERMYRKFLITRPVVALGADVGYLPGTLDEKLHYWMQPVHDNLEFIFSKMSAHTDEYYSLSGKSERKRKKEAHKHDDHHHKERMTIDEPQLVEQLRQKGLLSLDAITYMRGRSIPFQFVLIDEVQNLSPHEVKTIVSRAGEGTKVILAGDPYQIDSPYLDFTSNGLTVTTEKFKDHPLFGTVFLEMSERSELAKLAAEIL
ncbi:MAG: PhoH family protein [candidate division TM6 bacterium GW2011_GWF2_38_10]|nr:MAG: PhoH family protein [candidate division TM6 bacterium GW2011_GWF2_38_10]